MRPFHKTKQGQIVLGDSLCYMRDLKDRSVDLIVTSPPFALVRKKDYGNVESHEYIDWFSPFGQASAHLKDAERINVSPHILRHTFLRKLAEEKGVHYAKEASGYRSDRYIWRYVKPNSETLADAIDALD
jgi:DNA modification methylase